jgi:hypothetical protein
MLPQAGKARLGHASLDNVGRQYHGKPEGTDFGPDAVIVREFVP